MSSSAQYHDLVPLDSSFFQPGRDENNLIASSMATSSSFDAPSTIPYRENGRSNDGSRLDDLWQLNPPTIRSANGLIFYRTEEQAWFACEKSTIR